MKLHEKISINNMTVLRVPGGWIYYTRYADNGNIGVFVPYNDKF